MVFAQRPRAHIERKQYHRRIATLVSGVILVAVSIFRVLEAYNWQGSLQLQVPVASSSVSTTATSHHSFVEDEDIPLEPLTDIDAMDEKSLAVKKAVTPTEGHKTVPETAQTNTSNHTENRTSVVKSQLRTQGNPTKEPRQSQDQTEKKPTSNQGTQDLPVCSWAQRQVCQHDVTLAILMTAIPHTASSTTTRFFKASEGSWKRVSSICGPNQTATWSNCQLPESETPLPTNARNIPMELQNWTRADCAARQVHWYNKVHSNLGQHIGYSPSPHTKLTSLFIHFTTLRDPAQLMISHYRERRTWDKQWYTEYGNETNIKNISLADWVEHGWWRHNLLVKAYATSSSLLWTKATTAKVVPPKNESDFQNDMVDVAASDWYQLAWKRLRDDIPFFGIQERMLDSLELFQFYTCQFAPINREYVKKPKPVPPEVQTQIERHFRLDRLLYDEAVELFEERLADMRKRQAQGWKCDLNQVLSIGEEQKTTSPFGLKCSIDRGDSRSG